MNLNQTPSSESQREVRFDPADLFAKGSDSRSQLTSETVFRVSAPFDELVGRASWQSSVVEPLRRSIGDLAWRQSMVLSGERADGLPQVAAWGHLEGVMHAPWCGLSATGRRVSIRVGCVADLAESGTARCTVMIDIADLAAQVGQPLTRDALGDAGPWPEPQATHATGVSAETLEVVRAMQTALHDHATTRDEMLTAEHLRYWGDDFVWAGPGGIGTTRGGRGFVDDHQLSFRTAFPDRVGGGTLPPNPIGGGAGHFVKFADGCWAVTGGWPSVSATHHGDGWLGLRASGRRIFLRVFDFYEVRDGLISMNWVFIDIVDFLRQVDQLPTAIREFHQQLKGGN